MKFFGIPSPKSSLQRFGMGIFNFLVNRKTPEIPKFRGSESRFDNLGKIPNLKIPKKARKSQNFSEFLKYSRDFQKIPRIQNFSEYPGSRYICSRDFNLRDSRNLYAWDPDFFHVIGYSDKKPPLEPKDIF